MSALARMLFGFAVALLPAAFRRSYGREMVGVVEDRLAGSGGAAALLAVLRESGDVARVALRLRLDASPHLRPALLSGLALTLLAGWLALRPGGAPDRIDFAATDPAGEFTLSIRAGRLVGATLDRRPVPRERLVHAGDSIRVLAPGGGVVLAVAFDAERARIDWEGRSPDCRGQAEHCLRDR